MPRPDGYRPSPETRARISAGVRAALAEGRGVKKGTRHRGTYRPPEEFRELFDHLLRAHVGVREAERMIREHVAVVERRRQRQQQSASSGTGPRAGSESR